MRRIIALALTSLAAVSFTGCGRPAGDKAGQRPATAVEVEPVRRETVARTVQLLGTLQGESQVTVMSKVTGRVTEIVKPEGSTVAAGEPLAYVVNDVPGMDYQPGPVISPIAGTVGRVYVEAGQTVAPTMPFATVASFSGRLKARAAVSDADLPFVSRGASAVLTFSALPDTTFAGTVAQVSPMLDPVSRTATVEIAVPNPGRRLVPGMACGVRLELERREAVTALPLTALFSDGPGRVAVLEGSVARFRQVRIGLVGDRAAEVVSGLEPGEKVITTGKERVADGDEVRPVEAGRQ